MKTKKIIIISLSIIVIAFFTWRFIRPMNIFVVTDKFAWPVDTKNTPPILGDLSAETCGACHQEFYAEWKTTIHSKAWTDPYFQADWQFDSKQHVCRLCHTPLDRQQPHTVLGYRDSVKWDPILEDNPNFDAKLQHEGVTCAACHYRDGKIIGVLGNTNAPHPVKKLADPNQVCVRCHVVDGEQWDTFFRFPPCGTVAEIKSTNEKNLATRGETGEVVSPDTASLGCVQCHMPVVERALVKGGEIRKARHHYWRGGHDPEMVKKALSIKFIEDVNQPTQRRFSLTIANTGAAHYVPTGTPDRYLEVKLRVLDSGNNVLSDESEKMIRTVLWRPFIVDLTDTRLARWQPRTFSIDIPDNNNATVVEAVVSYHLLNEKRRKRIGYKNTTPISYDVFKKTLSLK